MPQFWANCVLPGNISCACGLLAPNQTHGPCWVVSFWQKQSYCKSSGIKASALGLPFVLVGISSGGNMDDSPATNNNEVQSIVCLNKDHCLTGLSLPSVWQMGQCCEHHWTAIYCTHCTMPVVLVNGISKVKCVFVACRTVFQLVWQ